MSLTRTQNAAAGQGQTAFACWLGSLIPAVYPSHAALARELNVPTSRVTRWRQGVKPHSSALRQLAEVTGTKPEVLRRLSDYRDGTS